MKPYSFKTLYKSDVTVPETDMLDSLVLENKYVRYEFSEDGYLISALDKVNTKEILASDTQSNVFSLYEDRPNNWDAWDIDFFYQDAMIENAKIVKITPLYSGTVRQGIQLDFAIGNSIISQSVYLSPCSTQLDFVTTVNWQEMHKMLRVAFPVNIQSEFASFDIQYGYVKRPTHQNTPWDKAKFEVVAHRYADLSDNDYGVALLNDCKYGYRVQDNILDLNVLRSSTNPDPDADIGEHKFTYSLYPHAGDLIRSDVISKSAQFNQDLVILEGFKLDDVATLIQLSGEGLSIESVKKAEKENCLIIRIIETLGRQSKGKLQINNPNAVLVETELMEWNNGPEYSCEKTIYLSLKPFEIRTYKMIGLLSHGV